MSELPAVLSPRLPLCPHGLILVTTTPLLPPTPPPPAPYSPQQSRTSRYQAGTTDRRRRVGESFNMGKPWIPLGRKELSTVCLTSTVCGPVPHTFTPCTSSEKVLSCPFLQKHGPLEMSVCLRSYSW